MKPTCICGLGLTLFLAAIIAASSCRKMTASQPGPAPDTTITDTTLFIDITVGGIRVLGIEQPSGKPSAWGNVWGPIDFDSSFYPYDRVGTVFVRMNAGALPGFAFSVGNFNLFTITGPEPQAAGLPVGVADSAFGAASILWSVPAGDTSFSQVGNGTILFGRTITRTLLSPGVNISFTDSTGHRWETAYGPATQTGGYFTITHFQLQSGSTASMAVYATQATLTAVFACRLYDQTGHALLLTNGRMRQRIWL